MRNVKGFTLIEVVVITLIIAVLSMIIAPSFRNSTLTNDMEKAKMSLIEINNAVKLYNEINPNSTIGNMITWSDFQKLTNESSNGFACLQTPGRWTHNGSLITFKGLDCNYRIMSDYARAQCLLPKYNDEGGEKDCYWFTIFSANPALVTKERKENVGYCNVH